VVTVAGRRAGFNSKKTWRKKAAEDAGHPTPDAELVIRRQVSGVRRPQRLGCGVCCFLFQVEAEEEPEEGDDAGDDEHGDEAEGVY